MNLRLISYYNTDQYEFQQLKSLPKMTSSSPIDLGHLEERTSQLSCLSHFPSSSITSFSVIKMSSSIRTPIPFNSSRNLTWRRFLYLLIYIIVYSIMLKRFRWTLLTSNLTFDYLGKYNAGSIVITIPGNNGLDLDTVGVSCTSIPR